MHTEQMKLDVDHMIEASQRVWNIEDHERIKNSAEQVKRLIDLATPVYTKFEKGAVGGRADWCPTCGKRFYDDIPKFCDNCSQAIKKF